MKIQTLQDKISREISKRVLFRIYVIWFFRRIIPLMLAQITLLALAIKIFANKVFVAKILQNTADISAKAGYWEVLKSIFWAFARARFFTQAAILFGLGFGALIIRDFLKAMIAYGNTFREREE